MTIEISKPDVAQGLTSPEAAERVAAGLANVADTRGARSLTDIIRTNTLTSFNLVIVSLWVLMVIAGAAVQDMLFVVAVVINSLIGIVQEWRAKRTLERLSVIGEARPLVRRDGQDVSLRPGEVVRDDVVLLRTGDQVVVDGPVVSSDGLEIDESLLTGEADPVAKSVDDEVRSGSFVVAGSGAMIAVKVGEESYATALAAQARVFTVAKSELMASIMKFVRIMTYILIPIGILLFVSQLRSAPSWREALVGTVAGVVTMVPEGLVLLTSVAMAVAVVRLGRKRALVQEMPAVETLARVDVVCVDKTGTLTEPGMAVLDVVVLEPSAPVDDALSALATNQADPNPTLAAVAVAYPGHPGWVATGGVPFSSARKWSSVTFADHGSWVFGAPEILLADGHPARAKADELAGGGNRVLLLATASEDQLPDADRGAGDLTAVALVQISQRLRSDAADTVQYFLDQGVTVKVISGDNPTTVGAIAQQAGIPLSDSPFDARSLPEDQEELADVLESHGVFGRVTPAQKRAIVGALQSRGHVVAMTGDGVNDVLALKDADLGIAMGSGAGATRSVAQLVLLDDAFSVMPSVVAEGRRVLGNIERVSDLFLTKSIYAGVLALLTGVATLPFPFLPRHLTVTTALTIGIPGFFLALMPNTARFRPGFLNRVLRFTIPAGVVTAATAFGSYYSSLAALGGDGDPTAVAQAQVNASITLFCVALTVLLLVARPWNALRLLIVAAMAGAFVLFLTIPWLSDFFALTIGTPASTLASLAWGLGGAALVVGVRQWSERGRAE